MCSAGTANYFADCSGWTGEVATRSCNTPVEKRVARSRRRQLLSFGGGLSSSWGRNRLFRLISLTKAGQLKQRLS